MQFRVSHIDDIAPNLASFVCWKFWLSFAWLLWRDAIVCKVAPARGTSSLLERSTHYQTLRLIKNGFTAFLIWSIKSRATLTCLFQHYIRLDAINSPPLFLLSNRSPFVVIFSLYHHIGVHSHATPNFSDDILVLEIPLIFMRSVTAPHYGTAAGEEFLYNQYHWSGTSIQLLCGFHIFVCLLSGWMGMAARI